MTPRTSTADTAETINATLRSLQHWMATNPCPDRELSDRINLVAARYGYLELVDARDRRVLGDEHRAALNKRIRKLNNDLVMLIAEVEQFRTEHSADRNEN